MDDIPHSKLSAIQKISRANGYISLSFAALPTATWYCVCRTNLMGIVSCL